MSTQQPDLRTAAQAVIDRWETPLWKDAPATAGYIAALRDALAADHPEHRLDMVGQWYMVNRDGMATLCTDRADAEKEAADAQSVWPHMGPHRAVRLVEASFEAAARLEIESLRGRSVPVSEADMVLAAMETGEWELQRLLPQTCFTSDANIRHAWSVKRGAAPYCTEDGLRVWTGATPLEALRNGAAALGVKLPGCSETAALPEPDTHCFDDDTQKSVWSYSEGLMRSILASDRAMRAAQPAGAQQPGAAYAALPEPITYQIAVLKACEHGDALVGWRVEPSRQSFDASMRPKRKLYTEGDMRAFADATCALRASHGRAPAQPAPAAVADCTRSHPHENMDNACRAKAALAEMRSKAARGAEATAHDLDRFVALLTAKPTTQPLPAAQGDALSDAVRVPLDSLHADAAYLIGRLREGSMPYARGIEIIRERIDAAKAAIRARAAQGGALDAARLDWLIEQDNCVVFEGVNGFCLCWIDEHDPQQSEYQTGTFPTARAAIDAARAAQEGK